MAESAGVKVNALNAEIDTEKAIVSANCRNRMPVVPGKSATGTNTDTSTREVAITAPATSFIATLAALCGSVIPSTMWRSTFSITTMASSTTRPVASVIPKSVSVLIEKPSTFTKINVPISETGMVTAGINVLLQSCRNRKITRITSPIASRSVNSTSRMDSPITVVVSNATAYLRPGGKFLDNRSNSALAALSTSSALAPGSCVTPMPTASSPLKCKSEPYSSAPNSALPTSLVRTSGPSVPV